MPRLTGRPLDAAALAAGLVAVVSCRQVVGITDNSPSPDCASCTEESCSSALTSCNGSTGCMQHEACLSAAGTDPQRRAQCTADDRISLGTTTEVSPLAACVASHCSPACGLTCSGIGALLAPPPKAAACDACLEANGGCGPAETCARSQDCQAYLGCIQACATMDCNQACATAHSAGWTLFQQVDAVRKAACATDCAYGNNWTCVGHIVWPPPKVQTTTAKVVGLYARTTTGNPLVADAGLSLCGPAPAPTNLNYDPTCAFLATSPAMPATDAMGNATFSFPTALGVGLGQSGLNGYGLTRTQGYADSYFYWGFPLSEASLTLGPPFMAQPFVETLTSVPGTGQVWVVAFDCLDSPAVGSVEVVVSSTQKANQKGDFPGLVHGINMFSDVPVGPVTLTATPLGLQPSSKVEAWVYEGAVTAVLMAPTP